MKTFGEISKDLNTLLKFASDMAKSTPVADSVQSMKGTVLRRGKFSQKLK